MPWADNPQIDSLRLQYNSALAAHRTAKRALIQARLAGATPMADLVAVEKESSAMLEEVRAKLLAEMTKAITGGSEMEPPPES
jgi:hypothetical protein